MKSNFKSYRVKCTVCYREKKVTAGLMDNRDVMLFCDKCNDHTLHKKID